MEWLPIISAKSCTIHLRLKGCSLHCSKSNGTINLQVVTEHIYKRCDFKRLINEEAQYLLGRGLFSARARRILLIVSFKATFNPRVKTNHLHCPTSSGTFGPNTTTEGCFRDRCELIYSTKSYFWEHLIVQFEFRHSYQPNSTVHPRTPSTRVCLAFAFFIGAFPFLIEYIPPSLRELDFAIDSLHDRLPTVSLELC
jgi:hypothetical protein